MLSDISTLTLIFVLVAAFSAGFVDAISGGGGLIQLPALLIAFPDKEVAQVSGTNKLGSIFGTSAAALNYRRNIKTDPRLLMAMVLPAFIGSGAGSLLATKISTEQLKVAIVSMLIAVFLYTLAKPDLGRVEILRGAEKRQWIIGAFAGATIGFYDGFIGPGTGTLLMIVLVAALGHSFVGASAIAKVVNVSTNFASILVFGISGSILWVVGLTVGICNLAGGIVGSSVAIQRGSEFVRKFYLVVTFALIIRVLLDVL